MAGNFEVMPNTGAMFQNDRKETDKHPDRSGNGLLECPHCGKKWETWISGWIKKGRSGQFLSLAFRPKERQNNQGGGRGGPSGGGDRREYDGGGGSNYTPSSQRPHGGGGGQQRDWNRKDGDDIPF